jgi:hypothetical protein
MSRQPSPAGSAASYSSIAPPITCGCHAPRCEECFLCSKCGCDHDGIPVVEKMTRKRGRPPSSVPGAQQPHQASLGKPPLHPQSRGSTPTRGLLQPRAILFGSPKAEEEDEEDEESINPVKSVLMKRKAFEDAIGAPGWSHNLLAASSDARSSDLRRDQKARLFRALDVGVREMATALLPNDAAGLLDDWRGGGVESTLIKNITDILSDLPPQSISARTLAAVIEQLHD